MVLYYWKDKWRIQSSGLIEAEKGMDLNHITLADLFRQCATDVYGGFDKLTDLLNVDNCYIFEMMTPENLIVVQHKEYTIKLHGVRSLITLEELSIDSYDKLLKVAFEKNPNIRVVESYDEFIQKSISVLYDDYFIAKLKSEIDAEIEEKNIIEYSINENENQILIINMADKKYIVEVDSQEIVDFKEEKNEV
jgi:hypothetical protein